MSYFHKLYELNTNPGPFFEPDSHLPQTEPDTLPVKLIAYYLPQFHSIPENDQFWGAGFTEWTNTTKALPRYQGHYQPRLPADLGFYDLTDADVIRKQATLSRRAGIYGFCIHHYWFSGKSVLETPLKIILENPDINVRFFLNWANESWSRRWDGSDNDILLHQGYAEGDDIRFAESILPALKDPRYIRINGRPAIMIYRPGVIPNCRETILKWRRFFIDAGVGDPYFIMPQAHHEEDPRKYGLDAAAGFPPHNVGWNVRNDRHSVNVLDNRFDGWVASYDSLVEAFSYPGPEAYLLFPGVCPSWDNEARKPRRGFSFYGANPRKYGEWLRSSANTALRAAPDERIVFINAWNEWAEGAYLEPDRHYGYAFLCATRRVVDRLFGDAAVAPAVTVAISEELETKPSRFREFLSLPRRALAKVGSRISH